MDNGFKIKGHVKEYLDGNLISSHSNDIYFHLDIAFRSKFLANETTRNIRQDQLFDSANERWSLQDGPQSGRDGICIEQNEYTDRPYFSMNCSVNDSEYGEGYGIEYRGVMTSSEDRTIDYLWLGSGWYDAGQLTDLPVIGGSDTNGPPFELSYAFVNKANSPLSIASGQVYEVLWGIQANN